ncbi:hypothetical protein NSB25_21590 [Acetatifactor muris]|uniref:Methyltransferase domain protein n=1 Tax=Acetatifactor muris TaxID=879566 RepID=A0A2K4ZMB7_9FIRM|nr:hypothetical protein [Acetatifactor muris]MCR2049853.1 hypothetical protein [Acetatifactor muris]SOY31618.1 hypothetical protein AMURIS_04362 [Acetatifactor muris]
MGNKYNYDFYATRDCDTKYAADKVLDILANYIDISSAIDVGGGVGTWLKTIQEKFECPAENLLLLEGDYLQKKLLQIDEKSYIAQNLEERIKIEQRYDLAITLEVAEHLTKQRAETFCEDLTLLSNVVLFAAAVPFQGGGRPY